MRVYIEHDARMLASMGNVDAPACDGVLLRLGDPTDVLAHTLRSNPLRDHWLLDLDSPGKSTITWSGSLGDELFDAHPMTWLAPGHEAFGRFCDDLRPQLQQHGRTLCIQGHARHVLNDAQSCRTFLENRQGQPFQLALSPTMLLEPSMLQAVEDHLTRTFEMLGSRCAMLMLSDVELADDQISHVPLGRGMLDRDMVVDLIEQHVDAQTPIVLQPGHLDEQLQWLGRVVDAENVPSTRA